MLIRPIHNEYGIIDDFDREIGYIKEGQFGHNNELNGFGRLFKFNGDMSTGWWKEGLLHGYGHNPDKEGIFIEG
jgi:hypothetical protein